MKKHFLTENFYILVALYAVAVFLANDMFLPAIGDIAEDMGSSKGMISYGVGFYLLGALSLQFFAGPLSDKYGRRNSLLGGGLFFSIATFGIIFTHSVTTFLFFRFLEGAGTCMFSAAGMASLNEYYDEDEAVRAISLTVNVIMLAPILGPIIGALIIKFTSWRGIFAIDLLFIAIILILIYFYMPETSNRELSRNMTLKNSFQGLSLAFKNKVFILHSLSVASHAGMFLIWITAGAHMLIDNLHQSPQEYSFVQLPILLAYVIGNTISPPLVRKMKSEKVILISTKIIIALLVLLTGINLIFNSTLFIILITLSSLMFMRGIINSPYSQYILSLERKFQGSSASVMSIVTNGGTFVASMVASFFYNFNNLQYTLLMMSFSFLGVIFTYLGRSRSRVLSLETEASKDNL
ncbi:MFS transporter [Ilyobacter sp.]|uniref:MFS transporter n=1 Tax=Ilyobacter sp. TaxID=3100343 RepID=UPI003566F841